MCASTALQARSHRHHRARHCMQVEPQAPGSSLHTKSHGGSLCPVVRTCTLATCGKYYFNKFLVLIKYFITTLCCLIQDLHHHASCSEAISQSSSDPGPHQASLERLVPSMHHVGQSFFWLVDFQQTPTPASSLCLSHLCLSRVKFTKILPHLK